MKNKCCFVLIQEFPFFNGETFFDEELNHLSETFKKIIVFSVYGRKNIQFERIIPNNVEIVPLNVKKGACTNVITGIFSKAMPAPIGSNKSLKEMFYRYYVKGKLTTIYKKITKYVNKNRKALIEYDLLLYSYWLNLTFVFSFLQTKLQSIGFTDLKVVSRAHGYDIYSERLKFNSLPYQFESIRDSHKIFPCSERGTNYLKTKFPCFSDKIACSYLGVKETIASKNPNREIFGTCCVIRPIKQMDLFAEAFCKYHTQNPNSKWVCIGNGPDYQRIKNIIRKNNCQNSVIFVGEVTNEEVRKFLSHYKVGYFFNVSKDEGLPVSLMEAQSLGIPCIATNVGGNSEIVNSQNGILIGPINSPKDIIKTFETAIKIDDEKYAALRMASYENWKKKYNSQSNFGYWANYLSLLLK